MMTLTESKRDELLEANRFPETKKCSLKYTPEEMWLMLKDKQGLLNTLAWVRVQ